MEKELNDEELRNWVKACLALKYFKEGIVPFLSEQCEDLYIQNISNVKATCNIPSYRCTTCDIKKILPSHAQISQCNRGKCNCRRKNTVLCQDNGSCSELYDLIKNLHVNEEPNFSNTNCSLWSDRNRGPWEQMKSFIFTSGYKDTVNTSEADVTALIQIFENYKTMRNYFGNFYAQLDEIRQDRNTIYHSANMKLSNADLQGCITHLKNVLALQMFKEYESTTDLLSNLTELETNTLRITTRNEIETREEALQALKRELEMHTEQGRNIEDEFRRLRVAENVHKEKLEHIFKGLVKHIDTLGKEINKTTQHLLEHNVTVNDFHRDLAATIGTMVEWQQEHGVLLTENHKGIQELLRRMERLPQEIKEKQAEPECHDVVRAVIKVLFTTENGNVSEMFVKIAQGCTTDVDPHLVQHVTSVLNQLEKDGNKIVDIKNECVALYISVPSLENWIHLCRDWINGSLTKILKPLQNYLRKLQNCETLELRFGISEPDFIKSANSLLDRSIALTKMEVGDKDCTGILSVSRTSPMALLESGLKTGINEVSVRTNFFDKYDTEKTIDDDSIDKTRLLIKGIPIDTTECKLTKYILEATGYHPVQGSLTFHKSDIGIAMVSFQNEIDFEMMVNKCKGTPFIGGQLRFNQVCKCNCIYIANLPANVDKDEIVSSFESFTVGISIDQVLFQDRYSCLAFFSDTSAVDLILSTRHKVDGKDVDVYRYFPCIERTESVNVGCFVYNNRIICVCRNHSEQIDECEAFVSSDVKNDQANKMVLKKRLSKSAHVKILLYPNVDDLDGFLVRLLSSFQNEYRSVELCCEGFDTAPLNSIVSSVKRYLKSSGVSSLDKIRLCSTREEYVQFFLSALQDFNKSPRQTQNASQQHEIPTFKNKVLLEGLGPDTKETDLENYLLQHSGYELVPGSVTFHATKKDTAMVTFVDDIDFRLLEEKCSSKELGAMILRFNQVPMSKCLAVSNLPATANAKTICSFFGEHVVQQVKMIPGGHCWLVTFHDYTEAERFYATSCTVDGQVINTHRYFACIERTEPTNIAYIRVGDLTMCFSVEDLKDMDYDTIDTEQIGSVLVLRRTRAGLLHATIHWNSFRSLDESLRIAYYCGYKSIRIILNTPLDRSHIDSLVLACESSKPPYAHLDKIHVVCSMNAAMLGQILNCWKLQEHVRRPTNYRKSEQHCITSPLLRQLYETSTTTNPELQVKHKDYTIPQYSVDTHGIFVADSMSTIHKNFTGFGKHQSTNIQMFTKTILIKELKPTIKEKDVQEFIGKHTPYKMLMGSMVFHYTENDTAMITFDGPIDYEFLSERCRLHQLHGRSLSFSKVTYSHCVLVSKIHSTDEEPSISAYFQTCGYDVERLQMLPNPPRCLVYFEKHTDVDKVLTTKPNINGRQLNIYRYWPCIERTEPDVGYCTRIGSTTVCVSRGDWKEMYFDEIDQTGEVCVRSKSKRICAHLITEWSDGNQFTDISRVSGMGYRSFGIIFTQTKTPIDKAVSVFIDNIRKMKTGEFVSLDKVYFCSTVNDTLAQLEALLKRNVMARGDDDQAIFTGLLSKSRWPWMPY